MKLILSLTALIFTATALRAQVVVTNPVSDILSQTLHAEDIAKTMQMINNQVQQINKLTQQLQQIQAYMKAFGDLRACCHLLTCGTSRTRALSIHADCRCQQGRGDSRARVASGAGRSSARNCAMAAGGGL